MVFDTKSYNTTGERVRLIRKRHEWTQERLADAIGVDPNYVSMIENNRRNLSKNMAQKIAAQFPPLRYQFLLCEDSFETDQEVFDSFFEQHKEGYEKRMRALTILANLRDYEISLDSSGLIVGPSGGYEDIYRIKRDGSKILVPYTELMEWAEDLSDFLELKIERSFRKKRGTDNG